MKLPKEVRDVAKKIDRSQFEIGRLKKHWAVTERATGQVVMTLHANHGGRGRANQIADLRKAGVLR